MSPELERLISLQALDTRIKKKQDRLDDLPADLASTQKAVKVARAALESHEDAIRQAALKRREEESTIEILADEERKFESRTIDVKTNEELRALQTEIQTVRSRRSKLETLVLEGMEEEEQQRRESERFRSTLRAAEERHEAETRSMVGEKAELENQMSDLGGQRLEIISDVKPALRRRYQRILEACAGLAVVPLVKNACGGCLTAQPPQRCQEIRGGDLVVICEFCGRLVVGEAEIVA